MTIMDREAVDEAKKGLFGRPGPKGFKDKADPYDTDLAKERLKKEQQMLDNLLHLKDQLEQELPFMFLRDLDPSYFAKDVVFKEPHLPPIRGRASYQLFLRGLKDAGNLLFEDPGFGVVRATHHEKDGLVKVRWKISGKYKAPFNLFQSSQGCFDGISYYYVDGSSGLVSVHQVDYHIPILPPVVREQNAFVWLDKAFAGVPAPSVPACGT
jgi:hypothetical protein